MSDSLWPHGLQHTRLPCRSPNPSTCSYSCRLSRWGRPTISSSVIPFSSCLQSFPASGVFLFLFLFFQWVNSWISWPKYWNFSFSISPSGIWLPFLLLSINLIVTLIVTIIYPADIQYLKQINSVLLSKARKDELATVHTDPLFLPSHAPGCPWGHFSMSPNPGKFSNYR